MINATNNTTEVIKEKDNYLSSIELKMDRIERIFKQFGDQILSLAKLIENHEKQLIIIKNAMNPNETEKGIRINKERLIGYHSMSLINKKSGQTVNIAIHDGKEWTWVAPQLDNLMEPFLNELLDHDIESVKLIYR